MNKIQVRIILEILGRPAENVQQGLSSLIKRISSESGVRIIEETTHAPIEVKTAKDLYSSFSELVLELDSLDYYFGILFAYMPSHVEIITPENLSISNQNLNELGNRILQRLHEYDSIAKKMVMDRDILMKKLYEVAPHLFKKDKLEAHLGIDSKEEKNKPIKKSKKSKKS
jgi:hypothetical protein